MKTKTLTLDENQLLTLISSLSIASSQINTISSLPNEIKSEQIKKIDDLVALIDKIDFNEKEENKVEQTKEIVI